MQKKTDFIVTIQRFAPQILIEIFCFNVKHPLNIKYVKQVFEAATYKHRFYIELVMDEWIILDPYESI